MKTVLTIAGSDCSGGAGIQADLKTMTVLGVYGMSVISALTAQNTRGVQAVQNIEPSFVAAQIDSVFSDIRPDAVKIGMVSTAAIVRCIAESLQKHKATRVVLDPVMVSTSGSRLMEEDAQELLCRTLLPLAGLITPNLYEAEILWGRKITSEKDMETAGRDLLQLGCPAVLIKGGHLDNAAHDVLCTGQKIRWYKAERIPNPHTHGSGCTLSAAIASYWALGFDLEEAVGLAKEALTRAIAAGLDLGAGRGPLCHQALVNR